MANVTMKIIIISGGKTFSGGGGGGKGAKNHCVLVYSSEHDVIVRPWIRGVIGDNRPNPKSEA